MGRHVILCAISTIQPKAAAKSYQYRAEGSRVAEYSGTQTNEAPVKCLIECYGPADMVLCLTSEQVRQPRTEGPGTPQSAYEYFAQAVRGFCASGRKKPFPVPKFVPIDYQTDNAGRSMSRLLEQLREGDEVYMDVTGGGRDAMFLMMMALQMLQYKRIRLVKAVYSDFAAGQVRDWRAETDLFELLKAVEDFTSYGKADKLCRYFGIDGSAVPRRAGQNKAVGRFCAKAREFSRSLALCRTDNMEETVRAIQKAMSSAVNNPGGGAPQPDLQLFLSLIPRMQEDFVQESEKQGELMLDLIEWCVGHQFWLQALALYRENLPQCLFELGILRVDEALCRDLCAGAKVQHEPQSREWYSDVVFSLAQKRASRLSVYSKMSGIALDPLGQILMDWDLLRLVRNVAIHSGEPQPWEKRRHPSFESLAGQMKAGNPEPVERLLRDAIRRVRACAPQ